MPESEDKPPAPAPAPAPVPVADPKLNGLPEPPFQPAPGPNSCAAMAPTIAPPPVVAEAKVSAAGTWQELSTRLKEAPGRASPASRHICEQGRSTGER